MTPHLTCIAALTEAMALPSVVAVPDQALRGDESLGVASGTAQGPPRRQWGEVRRYERRRAG